jgi:hypothetical protein
MSGFATRAFTAAGNGIYNFLHLLLNLTVKVDGFLPKTSVTKLRQLIQVFNFIELTFYV